MFEKHNEHHTVRMMELNFKQQVSLPTLCRLAMDTADTHSIKMGFGLDTLMSENRAWVLLKFRIKVDRYPVGRSKIGIETWPSGAESRYAFREFRIADEEGKVFAEASSVWVMVDLEKMRPIKISDTLIHNYKIDETRLLEIDLPSIKQEQELEHEMDFQIRLSDIDPLMHVHNLRYIEWIEESVPEDVWKNSEITDLAVQFRKQALFGQLVHSKCYLLEGNTDKRTYQHLLQDSNGDDLFINASTTRVF